MNILLLGKNGQLGKEFIQYFEENDIPYTAVGKDECNILNENQVESVFASSSADVVINCTGYVFIDKAEGEGKELCFALNRDAVGFLTKTAALHNMKIVHFSTDYVFDGKKKAPYTEEDETHPLNVYGQSKLEGEELAAAYSNSLTLRTSWLYGRGENNFIRKFLGFAAQKDVLPMTYDEVSVPTSTAVVMEGTMQALENSLFGLYHLTNSGYASRLEFAQEILDILGMKEKKLDPITMASWNAPAKRATFSAMSNELISKTLQIEIPHWKESLREFLI